MSRCALIPTILVLSACATTAGYEKMLGSWLGQAEVDLVRSWGPPVQAYEAGGRKFISYSSQRSVYVPGSDPTYQTQIIGNTAYSTPVGGNSPINIGMSCVTTFELQQHHSSNIVVSYSYKGNDCKAFEK